MGSEKKIQCALIDENIDSKPTKCVTPKIACMHRAGKRCNWVEFGDTESFLSAKNVTPNKFAMESKKGTHRIRILLLIDSYYEFLKAKFNTYPSINDNVFTCLEFPFDYPNHYWSKILIEKAMETDSIEEFCKDLPEKSIELFNMSLTVLTEYFDDDN